MVSAPAVAITASMTTRAISRITITITITREAATPAYVNGTIIAIFKINVDDSRNVSIQKILTHRHIHNRYDRVHLLQ